MDVNTDKYTLMLGDCLERMDEIPDSSIDLVVTSPPYDNLRTYNGTLNDWTEEKWKKIQIKLTKKLKDGGVIVWVAADATVNGSETLTSMRQAIHFKDVCGLRVHDTMIYKTNKPPLTHNRYEQCWEYMFVFSKGAPSKWNPLKEPSKYAGQKRCATMRQDGDNLSNRSAKGVVRDEKQKENIWYLPRSSHSDGAERRAHPATFPINLARDHILSWSNDGDVVLDPFAGSGTTGVACANTGRRFIGIEREMNYFNIASERIKKAYES